MTITEAVKSEGIARELVNRIQNLRKDSGFEVTDVIDVFILNNEFMDKAVQNNLEYIKAETLTHTLHAVNALENGIEVNFDAITTKLLIKKYIK